MATLTGRIRRLADALETRFDNVVDRPVEVVGGYPQTVIYPGSPLVEPGEFCDREINVQVIVYLSRVNSQESIDHALATVEPVAAAAVAADAGWKSMTYQPIPVGGVDHLAAVHDISIYT